MNTDNNNIIGLTNTTNSNINLINNLNTTVGSLITSGTFNSNLNNYLLTSNFNSTINSYLLTSNFNNTINSYLRTVDNNNTMLSYLTIGNFNSTISSYLTTSAFNTSLNSSLAAINSITNPSFFGTVSIKGNTINISSIYTNNYNTNYSSLRLVNPNIIELSISNPLTTASNILMSLDNANGADFNCLLSCETNFSVLGASELIGNVSCNKILNVSGSSILNETINRGIMTCNSSLNVSGSSILRSSLSVSGTSNLNNVILNNASTVLSSFFISGATTLNSTLNVSGNTLLRSDLNVSGTATLNNLTINGTLSGTFNSAAVGLSNVANTAPSDLPISTATQSALNNKQNKTTYPLPGYNNGTPDWFLLGQLTTGSGVGNVSTLEIESHLTYEGNPADEYLAYIHFATSNGFNSTLL